MKCPQCGYVSFDYLDRCRRCAADWTSGRALLGVQIPEAAPAQSEAPVPVEEEWQGPAASELALEEEFDRLYERLKKEEEKTSEVRWAGFFRRACAFGIDLLVLSAFSTALFYGVYVGYKVGLAAHHQRLSLHNLSALLKILLFAWPALMAGYFVLLHGMEGKTIGKWLLRMRVVGANRSPVTYRQALIRGLGYLPSAFLGLGFLWILLSREKRAWHDLLAGTWVIREMVPSRSLKN